MRQTIGWKNLERVKYYKRERERERESLLKLKTNILVWTFLQGYKRLFGSISRLTEQNFAERTVW